MTTGSAYTDVYECLRCGRPVAQSAASGSWQAVDDLPVTEACDHEPGQFIAAMVFGEETVS